MCVRVCVCVRAYINMRISLFFCFARNLAGVNEQSTIIMCFRVQNTEVVFVHFKSFAGHISLPATVATSHCILVRIITQHFFFIHEILLPRLFHGYAGRGKSSLPLL